MENRLIEAISGRIVGQQAVMPQVPVQIFTDGSSSINCDIAPVHCRFSFSVTLEITMVGPEEAMPSLHRKAKRAVAHEVFGDIQREIRRVMDMLHTESYREADDPVIARLCALVEMMEGDSAQ